MPKITLSKKQFDFIGKKMGWIKQSQNYSEPPKGSNLGIMSAEQMLWEIHRRNKTGDKMTLQDIIGAGEVGDSQALGNGFDLLRSKGFVQVEKVPGSEGDADNRNIVSITSKGQEFLNKRLSQPESATYDDVSKQYAQFAASQILTFKTADTQPQPSGTLAALLQKGWAKQLPDGSYARTFWPSGTDVDDPTNIMLKKGVDEGSIEQQPDGSFKLVE